MGGKQELRFAFAALLAGLAWGYMRHRRDVRAPVFAVLQGLEWFVAYGGAAALIDRARDQLDESDEDDEPVRITHYRQEVTDRTGTEG
ncbi:MAG TPA: hypothetical protein QF624_00085 [Dehalococcoidia bacterium]|nr:hypothetical protein [Dehalococcoidia bacterium]